MSDNAPVEGKVWAGTAGAGAGLTASAFLIWLLGGLVWGAPMDAAHATEAAASVPTPVIGMVMLGSTVGSAFAAGYRARHTPRPVDNLTVASLAPVRIVMDGKLVGTTYGDTPATPTPALAEPDPTIDTTGASA